MVERGSAKEKGGARAVRQLFTAGVPANQRAAEGESHLLEVGHYARSNTVRPDEAHYNLALVLRAEGNYKQAKLHLRKALAIDPRYTIARQALRDVQRATRAMARKRIEPSRR